METIPTRQLGTAIYTSTTRTTGFLASGHWRLSDAFNAIDQKFVLVQGARVQPLQAPVGSDELSTGWSLIQTDSIVLALSLEATAGVEVPAARRSLQTKRVPLQVKVDAWPFLVEGTLHLPPGVELLQHIHDPHHPFVPVTNARVTLYQNAFAGFSVPFLLVNRSRIEMVLDASEPGRPRQALPQQAVVQPPTAGRQGIAISGIEAADILAATAIFKGAPSDDLVARCEELCRRGRISRNVVEAGAHVFEQGDFGDSMYVVERGALEVLIRNPLENKSQLLGSLEAGDIFGEMAVLGEGFRTAAVRSKATSSLMVIHKEAIEVLLHTFAAASTRLMRLMLARTGGGAGESPTKAGR
ncbi:MAG: cyclic nucleotide-binding domain-containing protein [Chloroflexota bacterium]